MTKKASSPGDALLHVTVILEDVTRYHSPRTNTATNAECAALAKRLDILAVNRFSFNWQVTKAPRKAYKIVGKAWGEVVQECVVTLEPVVDQVSEEFSVYAGTEAAIKRLMDDGLLDEADDTPEITMDDTLDLADLAMQYFGLALNPYPRKEGAAIPAELTPPPANTVRLHIPLNPANDG